MDFRGGEQPGAGGNLGVEQRQVSGRRLHAGDGQTSNLAIQSNALRSCPYDPLKDLSPVALIVSAPVVLVVA